MVDDKVIVERLKSHSSLCPLSVWLRVMANRGVYRVRHFLLGCGELIPKRKLLKIYREHGKGARWLKQRGSRGQVRLDVTLLQCRAMPSALPRTSSM